MESWYRDRKHQNELVLLSENGFTTDQLTFRFLEHFIAHTEAGPRAEPKLLLMDNHNSHITPDFILYGDARRPGVEIWNAAQLSDGSRLRKSRSSCGGGT